MSELIQTGPFAGLVRHGYRVILADPPWRYRVWSRVEKGRRSADRHYPTMTIPMIRALPVHELADPAGCLLWLWITTPFVTLGTHSNVMRDWGFAPSSLGFTWVKLQNHEEEALFIHTSDSFHMGMGHTTRRNTELCFLGRLGAPGRKSKAVRELIVAPVRGHSRKPDEQYDRIEAYSDGPYLELFARRRRPGWTSWGDQLPPVVPADHVNNADHLRDPAEGVQSRS